ncbi:hypothetical protein NC652_035722 [Populus alba x Populus x berolinensis]|nr:hypothetical protein NC652_035722 [Populus alba x Populus x berolinensis]
MAPRVFGWIKVDWQVFVLLFLYKALRITGIDDRRYWNHVSSEESRVMQRFSVPAGSYSLFFKLQLGKTSKKLWPSNLQRRSTFDIDWPASGVGMLLASTKEIGGITMLVTLVVDSNKYCTTEAQIFHDARLIVTHTKCGVCLELCVILPQ